MTKTPGELGIEAARRDAAENARRAGATDLTDAIAACIEAAPAAERAALAKALLGYQTRYRRTWHSLNRIPFVDRLFVGIEDAVADELFEASVDAGDAP